MRYSALLVLALLAGCSNRESFSPTQYRGVDGQWLTSDTCEAFVSGVPYPRVVAFRLKGQSSPLRVSTQDQFYGIRTWYMETDVSDDTILLPASQVAKVERLDSLSARITAAEEPASGLQLIMEVSLAPRDPVLTVRHGFRNLRDTDRRICVWALTALEHNGMAVTPWRPGKDAIRTCTWYFDSDPSEPCLRLGKIGMGVDYRVPSTKGCYKVGANTDAGWVAFCRGRSAMVSRAPFNEYGEYPEGEAPISFYNCGQKCEWGFCEMEHVSELKSLPRGGTVWMEQKLTLMEIAPTSDTVDANIEAIKIALKRGGE
jgi:hypothetical protein